MVKVSLNGQMIENTKVSIKMIKKKVSDYSNGNIKNYIKLILILIIRNDGRKYKGKWKNGKQHGEGEFFNPKDNTWKKGLWNDGKRVRWIIE